MMYVNPADYAPKRCRKACELIGALGVRQRDKTLFWSCSKNANIVLNAEQNKEDREDRDE